VRDGSSGGTGIVWPQIEPGDPQTDPASCCGRLSPFSQILTAASVRTKGPILLPSPVCWRDVLLGIMR
jgi:hypothetical protein